MSPDSFVTYLPDRSFDGHLPHSVNLAPTEEPVPAPCNGHKPNRYTRGDYSEGHVSRRVTGPIVDAESERGTYGRDYEAEKAEAHWLRRAREEPIESPALRPGTWPGSRTTL